MHNEYNERLGIGIIMNMWEEIAFQEVSFDVIIHLNWFLLLLLNYWENIISNLLKSIKATSFYYSYMKSAANLN